MEGGGKYVEQGSIFVFNIHFLNLSNLYMETVIVSYFPEKCLTPFSPLINAFEIHFTCSVMLNTDMISNEKKFRLSKCFLSKIMCTSALTQRHSLISFAQEL